MKQIRSISLAIPILLVIPLIAIGQLSSRPDGMRFVPSVTDQIRSLTDRADPLGLHIGTSPDPSTCKHYQGMVRVDGADGTPFFILTRSGNTPTIPVLPDGLVCDDSPGETGNGNLVVFRMGSRDKNGERLRSNRLRKGVHVDDTPPPSGDIASVFYSVKNGGLVFRDGSGPIAGRYGHPGGMQVVGNILAVAVEHPYSSDDPKSLVMFFDITDPETPIFKSQFVLVDGNFNQYAAAGLVAITPMPDGRYLMAVTGGANNPVIHFYRSTASSLAATDPGWTYLDTWYANINRNLPGVDLDICAVSGGIAGANGFCLSPDEVYLEQNWPDGKDGFTHQTMQFLREGNINGTLYLTGIRGKYGSDTSTVDAYRIDCEDVNCSSGDVRLKRILSRDFVPRPGTGGEKLASFAAASTFYVSPSGELMMYAAEHDNDGPSGTVKAGEWRHRDVVREGSPTLLPTVALDGPFIVDEGSSASLTGVGRPPLTRPFVQLFGENGFRSFHVVADYDDYQSDDFNNLFVMEFQFQPPTLFQLSDRARSLNWYTTPGCSIEAVDRDTSGNLIKLRTLNPGAAVQRSANLAAFLDDSGTGNMDQVIDKLSFSSGCDNYYNTPLALWWDLDVNGSYETSGGQVSLGTAGLDGPSTVNIPVQARHPFGGPAGQSSASVTVRNVAPQLSQLRLLDAGGNQVNSVVPFIQAGHPVTLAASFSDPGLLDRQTARIVWGDGTTETQTAFMTFDEAFGDGAGSLAHTHRFNAAGTYSIALSVSDDDGGFTTQSLTLRVLTPEQAVAEIINLVNAAISGSTDPRVRAALEHARRALAGSHDHSSDGALPMIRAGNRRAAVAFIGNAKTWLRRAAVDGANVTVLIMLLDQVAGALNT